MSQEEKDKSEKKVIVKMTKALAKTRKAVNSKELNDVRQKYEV